MRGGRRRVSIIGVMQRLSRVAQHVASPSLASPVDTAGFGAGAFVGALVGALGVRAWQQLAATHSGDDDGGGGSWEEAVAGQVMVPRESGWVAPAQPADPVGGIDFTRSRVTFRIDRSEKPSATMSDDPPFDLNVASIPIDCVLTITETATGRSEVIVLGGNCKTETVGVEANIWMEPNADFVPIVRFTAHISSAWSLSIHCGQLVWIPAAVFGKNCPHNQDLRPYWEASLVFRRNG